MNSVLTRSQFELGIRVNDSLWVATQWCSEWHNCWHSHSSCSHLDEQWSELSVTNVTL